MLCLWMIQITGHPSITESSMVLPFQVDNLSTEYSQFRQNGLLKKKKLDRMTLRFFFIQMSSSFFFPKMTRTVVTWLEMMCLCSQNKKKMCFWVLLSNSLASKRGGTRKRKENFLSFCVCDVNVTAITLTRAKNWTRWPPIIYCLLELLAGILRDEVYFDKFIKKLFMFYWFYEYYYC